MRADGEDTRMEEVSGVRWGWLRFMYLYTLVGAGGCGLGCLVMPATMRSIFGWPGEEPITRSVIGSIYVAFGVLSVLGLREPLKFVPVLLLQLGYKVVFFAGAALPLLLSGRWPGRAFLTAAIFATYVVGDVIAIPWRYGFSARKAPSLGK